VEHNKERHEARTIQTQAVSPETITFPLAAQAARLLRQTSGRKDEVVALVTSLEPQRLPARLWLDYNRLAWDVEGMHQRLDISHNDDRCRFRTAKSLWVMGMFRRISNSLFMEWRSHQPHPEYKMTTDFQMEMVAENLRWGLRFVKSTGSGLKKAL
jgi:hypothetical protein